MAETLRRGVIFSALFIFCVFKDVRLRKMTSQAFPNLKIAITFLVDDISKNGLRHVKERKKSRGPRTAQNFPETRYFDATEL